MDTSVFLSFGTRGDVQPLALVARLYERRNRGSSTAVRFVTHASHAPWLEELFRDDSYVQLWPCATPPMLPPGGEAAPSSLWSDEQQATCLRACGLLKEDVGGSKAGAAAAAAPLTVKLSLIAFNLFALEGLVIADVTGAPAVALQPYPLPPQSSSPPRGLRRRLREDWPRLLDQLELASARSSSSRGGGGGGGSGDSPSLTLDEFEHWVWPVVTFPHWRDFRSRVAALARRPAVSPSTTTATAAASSSSPLDFCQLRAPPLLYGHSPLLLHPCSLDDSRSPRPQRMDFMRDSFAVHVLIL